MPRGVAGSRGLCSRGCGSPHYAKGLCRVSYSKEYHEANRHTLNHKSRNYQAAATLEKKLWERAKRRAREEGTEFNLSLSDIFIPEFCPYLEIKLEKLGGQQQPQSPALDRIDSSRGYIRGNIQVISHMANTMKSNASLTELQTFAYNVLRKHPTGGENYALEEG